MQSCSVHHCVLLLLTLTFTTAPVAAAVCRVQAKLHQRATLTCEHECPGEAKWTLQRNRSVVFARCDQTSCSSVVKGYEMSHGQYKKGDLSLTITAAEYSMRNTYACECGGIDYAVWRLSIETVFSAVQVKHDGDLILDLTVPEPVEVIYTSSDSADGERICNVTQRSLQCKAEYTHRASLRYPELTLRDVTYSDSGLYTIRDTENNEDIRVYAVAVTAPVADAVLPVQAKLHQRVTLPAPVAAADCRVQAKLHQRVTLPCEHECPGEAMWTLKSTRSVFARCDETSCSSVVKGYEMSHDQYLKGDLSLTITAAEFSMRNTYVCECRSIDYAVWRLRIDTVFSAVQKNPGEDLILDLSVPEPVEVIYTSSDSADGERICNVTQHSLQCKAEYTHRTSLRYPELTLRDVTYSDSGRYTIRDTANNEDIRVYAVSVTGLSKGMTAGIVVLVLLVLVIIGVIIYKWRAAEEERRKVENEEQAVARQMKQLLNLLQYENRRRKDRFNPFTRRMESIEKNPEELRSKMEDLKKMFDEVEKMINDLEKRYRGNRRYKDRVELFCSRRRGDLELCRNFYKTIQTESPESRPGPVYRLIGSGQLLQMMSLMERVLDNLERLRRSKSLESQSFLYTWVDSDLKIIKSWCKNTRDDLKRFKEEPGDEANVKLMIDTEALLSALGKWCDDKEEELQKYPKPVSAERSENQPPESEPLYHNV